MVRQAKVPPCNQYGSNHILYTRNGKQFCRKSNTKETLLKNISKMVSSNERQLQKLGSQIKTLTSAVNNLKHKPDLQDELFEKINLLSHHCLASENKKVTKIADNLKDCDYKTDFNTLNEKLDNVLAVVEKQQINLPQILSSIRTLLQSETKQIINEIAASKDINKSQELFDALNEFKQNIDKLTNTKNDHSSLKKHAENTLEIVEKIQSIDNTSPKLLSKLNEIYEMVNKIATKDNDGLADIVKRSVEDVVDRYVRKIELRADISEKLEQAKNQHTLEKFQTFIQNTGDNLFSKIEGQIQSLESLYRSRKEDDKKLLIEFEKQKNTVTTKINEIVEKIENISEISIENFENLTTKFGDDKSLKDALMKFQDTQEKILKTITAKAAQESPSKVDKFKGLYDKVNELKNILSGNLTSIQSKYDENTVNLLKRMEELEKQILNNGKNIDKKISTLNLDIQNHLNDKSIYNAELLKELINKHKTFEGRLEGLNKTATEIVSEIKQSLSKQNNNDWIDISAKLDVLIQKNGQDREIANLVEHVFKQHIAELQQIKSADLEEFTKLKNFIENSFEKTIQKDVKLLIDYVQQINTVSNGDLLVLKSDIINFLNNANNEQRKLFRNSNELKYFANYIREMFNNTQQKLLMQQRKEIQKIAKLINESNLTNHEKHILIDQTANNIETNGINAARKELKNDISFIEYSDADVQNLIQDVDEMENKNDTNMMNFVQENIDKLNSKNSETINEYNNLINNTIIKTEQDINKIDAGITQLQKQGIPIDIQSQSENQSEKVSRLEKIQDRLQNTDTNNEAELSQLALQKEHLENELNNSINGQRLMNNLLTSKNELQEKIVALDKRQIALGNLAQPPAPAENTSEIEPNMVEKPSRKRKNVLLPSDTRITRSEAKRLKIQLPKVGAELTIPKKLDELNNDEILNAEIAAVIDNIPDNKTEYEINEIAAEFENNEQQIKVEEDNKTPLNAQQIKVETEDNKTPDTIQMQQIKVEDNKQLKSEECKGKLKGQCVKPCIWMKRKCLTEEEAAEISAEAEKLKNEILTESRPKREAAKVATGKNTQLLQSQRSRK